MEIRSHASLLKDLYVENDYPSDRLFRDHKALDAFTSEFCRRTKFEFSPSQVAAETERIRKDKKHTGGLPKIGRDFSGPKFAPSPSAT
ncbi:MAG: hypothetical protein JWL69_688 [Phycisphaerales bacterium]|jgi:hypothetical protein|nr:hypothetical protein [Phycisphaerales bacterium]MDB5333187.1 hypothetical protein [Phycisphaerales bacterium]